MGFVRRRVSGNYFGGSSLIVPGQGVYSIKKYNNFIGKTGVPKENYDDIPQPTQTPIPSNTLTPTNTPQCKCYNFIYDFSGREDVCTARYIDCDGMNSEKIIGVGDNYLCTIDQESFTLTLGCNGSIIDIIDNGICTERCGLGECVDYEIVNPTGIPCELYYIDCYGGRGFYTVSPFETVNICSVSGFNYICKGGLIITETGVCV